MSFPFSPLPLTVQWLIDDAWTTIPSAKILQRGGAGITISRGRTGETQTAVEPTSVDFQINNLDGEYSPRNPSATNYGKFGNNTPVRVAVTGYDFVADRFDRVYAGQWGRAMPSGELWATTGVSGGSITIDDFGVTGSSAFLSMPAVGGYRIGTLEVGLADMSATIRGQLSVSNVTGTGGISFGLGLRGQALFNRYYLCRATVNPDESVTADISALGGTGALGSATVSGLVHTGQVLAIRAQCSGTTIRMRVWDPVGAEPSSWDVSVTNSEFTAAGNLHVQMDLSALNTNALPLHVTFTQLTLDRSIRATVEATQWPNRWVAAGRHIWVPMSAGGIMKRLGAPGAATTAHSALFRAIMVAPQNDRPLDYWPLEDAGGQGYNAAGTDRFPLRSTGAVIGWGQAQPPAGAAAALTMTAGAELQAPVTGCSADNWHIGFMIKMQPIEAGTGQFSIPLSLTTQGSYNLWQMLVEAGADGGMGFQTNTAGTSPVLTTFSSNVSVDDDMWHLIELVVAQSGADISVLLYVDGRNVSANTLTTKTNGKITGVLINPNTAGSTFSVENFGQLTIYSNDFPPDFTDAMNGHAGELAGRRVERLCLEDGIGFSFIGDLDDTAALGGQSATATTLASCQEATDADGGVLFEPRGHIGLGFRARTSLYNQTVRLALTYNAAGELVTLDPDDGDTALVNDVVASRAGGSFARSTTSTGPNSVEPPPDGVGTYPGTAPVNVFADDQLQDIAGWVRHLGSWDEQRYPVVGVSPMNMANHGKTQLMLDTVQLDIGDRFTIDGTPVWLPPGNVDQLEVGSTETLHQYQWAMTKNSTPAGPYTVGVLESGTLGRLDSLDTYSMYALSASDTTVKVGMRGEDPAALVVDATLWSTTGTPYDWKLRGGERATVTAMATNAATFVNVGTVTHGNNASVVPGFPASTARGDLLLVFAAIRNSGTGSVLGVTGYTQLAVSGNMALYAKVHTGTESAPTVSFTGGVANATTSAQMCAFRDAQPLVVGQTAQLNGSTATAGATAALDVTRGRCVILQLLWKQAAFTSVAALTGYTEIGDAPTTTGDDQSIAWDYKIQTTAAAIAADSFTSTGGVSAITRTITLALAGDVQTATITRAVSGIALSNPFEQQISLADPIILAR